jgi:hypothetical protein
LRLSLSGLFPFSFVCAEILLALEGLMEAEKEDVLNKPKK